MEDSEEKSRLETTLKTEEKTVDYAKTQIDEGELMTAKSILDQSLKKLEHLHLIPQAPQLERWRVALLQKI